MSGMLPQCKQLPIEHGDDIEPIFNQGDPKHFKNKVVPPGCPGMPAESLIDATIMGGSINKLTQTEQDLVQQLGDAIGCCSPQVCKANPGATTAPGGECSLMQVGPAVFGPSHFWSLYNGTLAITSNLAEFLQLAYLNNMSLDELLPGKSEYEISRLTQLHQLNMRVTDGNDWVARSFGTCT